MYPIIIDVSRLLRRAKCNRLPTGVDRVSQEYIRHYGQQAKAMVRRGRLTFVFSKSVSDQVFKLLLSPTGKDAAQAKLLMVKGMLSSVWEKAKAPYFLFNTGHSGLERKDYGEILQKLNVRPIFLIHDLIPISHPEYCREGELQRHRTRMRNALVLGSGIVTNSQATLNALMKYANFEGLPMRPATAALLAPGITPCAPGPRPIRKPYFVILSTIEPRKNHWLLLQLWRSMVISMGNNTPQLVIIGQRGWECENAVDLLERCELLRPCVTELPDCSDADLKNYLHHAQALLFPSFAEGYGMPLAEALTLGVPVIASDLPVFREIAEDIPEYIDPLDGKAWIKMIMEYSAPVSTYREMQLDRIKRFTPPLWSEHFDKVDALLERLSKE